MDTDSSTAPPTAQRQDWMGVLACCEASALEQHMAALGPLPAYDYLRAPEPGAVMVRGRAGGNGRPFNLGEMTVTRCAVRLRGGAGGHVGHAYVQGRDTRHAELAALADALLQDADQRARLLETVIEPLRAAAAARRAERSRKAAATRVDFFTLSRTHERPGTDATA